MAQSKLHDTDYQIQFKSGLAANINAAVTKNLAVAGEPAWTTDDGQLYVFNGTIFVRVPTVASDGTLRIPGLATNYSEFEADGTLVMVGNATVWEDLRVPLSSIKRLGFSDPDWVQFKDDGAASVGVYGLAFDNNTDEEVFFTVQIPHSYKQGSDITPHVHWTPSTADAGGVTWGLEYTWVNIDGTFGNTTIITTDDATDTTSHKHHVIGFSALTGSGKTISSILMCRLFRDISDANDTYAADAFLLEIDFHYEIDTIGSRQILTK